MTEGVFSLGSREVRVGRGGIRFSSSDADEQGTTILNGCLHRVVRVRVVTIVSPPDAAPGVRPRNFIELLAWRAMSAFGGSAMQYVLQWELYELREKSASVVAHEEIDVTSDWRKTTMPADFDASLTMEMIRSGHVRWRMEGAPPKRGWIMLPERWQ
jgi:hypothetical protein